MRSKSEILVNTLLPIVAGASCMITLLVTMSAYDEWRNATPRVGDLVAFVGSDEVSTEDGLRLVAQRPTQSGCVLDLNVLQRSGGSLVVESQMIEAKGSFKVHWAGQRTATDSGNCGTNADLILSKHELRVLASAAGGYELGEQTSSFFMK